MTVTMYQRRAAGAAPWPIRISREELTQAVDQRLEALRPDVAWKEIEQFVLEHRRTTRLQHDNRSSLVDFVRKRTKDLLQPAPGQIEHAVVVMRPAAAQLRLRDRDREADHLQRLHRSQRDLGMEVVGKRV